MSAQAHAGRAEVVNASPVNCRTRSYQSSTLIYALTKTDKNVEHSSLGFRRRVEL